MVRKIKPPKPPKPPKARIIDPDDHPPFVADWFDDDEDDILDDDDEALDVSPFTIVDAGGMLPAFLQSVLDVWQAATPEQRHEISEMSAGSTPEDVAKLRAKLAELDARQVDGELADLLGRLSLEQLRAIAKRRRWTLRA